MFTHAFLLLMLFAVSSCEKDRLTTAAPADASTTAGFGTFGEIPQGPGPTRLGRKLPNPYNVENMREAARLISPLLPPEKTTIITTHHYVKVFPTTGADFVALMEFAEDHELNFELQPHDYEVLYNGDDGYVDPSVPEGSIPPLYGALPLSLIPYFPDVAYEVLEELYLDKDGIRLTPRSSNRAKRQPTAGPVTTIAGLAF